MIGGFGDDDSPSAWVFTRSGGAWMQQAAKLTTGTSATGISVALSGDGSTVLLGAPGDPYQLGNPRPGAVSTFAHSGADWTQKGAKLTARGSFGRSVALSYDGNTALVGTFGSVSPLGSGRAWQYAWSGDTWSLQGPGLEGPFWVTDVALSADATTALVGGVTAFGGGFLGARVYAVPAPGAPTDVAAAPLNGRASVSFTAPAGPVASYTVTASPGGATATGAASPIVVDGLSNGTAYTFTVTAANAGGASQPSSSSEAVVPVSVSGRPEPPPAPPSEDPRSRPPDPPSGTARPPLPQR